MRRLPLIAGLSLVFAAMVFSPGGKIDAIASGQAPAVEEAPAPCGARSALDGSSIAWYPGPADDAVSLDKWCRGVGPALLVQAPSSQAARTLPPLEELVVLTWNAHLAEGRLTELIARLRAGELTQGRPVQHFVLLLQELYRRGPDVPAFTDHARSARSILPRDPRTPDARDYAQTLGLSIVYAPSMRNGAEVLEDRGNAIVSSEPLLDVFAMELPMERQRRVVIGAAIEVATESGPARVNLVDVHLEPLSSPASLWVFRNPRPRQVAAVLELLKGPRFESDQHSLGTILGGDFNTIQGGVEEDAYLHARAWSRGLVAENSRSTHHMGRIDHLFVRLVGGWTATTTRVDERFGSDHHPVLARFARGP